MDSRRPPMFFRPPPVYDQSTGSMPWGSPRPPFQKGYRVPYVRPPFGMTSEGLLLPCNMQPPPMFGPRGATLPPHLMDRNRQFQRKPSTTKEIKYEFWCDPCDRGFDSEDLLNNHNKEHQKCGIDGCTFTAHVNVVTKHIQMQHSTGLYKKICKTDTPEDIQNWINERKKNYPSRENIEKKRAQEKECFDRGEKLRDDKRRFNNRNREPRPTNGYNKFTRNEKFPSNQRKNTFNKNKTFPNNQKSVKTKNIQKLPAESENSPDDETYCSLKSFKGTSQLIRDDVICDDTPIDDDNLDIEDDEWKDGVTCNTANESSDKLTVCNALSNLISAYDSSDNEESVKQEIDSKSNKTIIEKCDSTKSVEIKITNFEPLELIDDGNSSGPEEVKTVKFPEDHLSMQIDCSATDKELSHKRVRKRKHSADESVTLKQSSNSSSTNVTDQQHKKEDRTMIVVNKRIPKPYHKSRLPKTLLEKLLEKDIRKERNVILQCVHYVVQNEFYANQ